MISVLSFLGRCSCNRALLDCSLRSLRCLLGCRRLRRIWRNGKALFRHLLLQIGGANIGSPPTSSFAEEKRLRSLLLSTAARDLPTLPPHSSLPSATPETSLKRPHQVACSPILRVRPERTRGAGLLRSRGAAIRSRVLHRCDRSAAHRTNRATRTKDGAKRRDKGLSDAAPGFHTDLARMCCSHSARHYIGPDSPTELAVNPSDGCAARLRHLRLRRLDTPRTSGTRLPPSRQQWSLSLRAGYHQQPTPLRYVCPLCRPPFGSVATVRFADGHARPQGNLAIGPVRSAAAARSAAATPNG